MRTLHFATISKLATAASLSLLLAACGGSSGSNDSGGETQSSGSATIGITDAPVDGAEHVVVEFTGIQFVPADDGNNEAEPEDEGEPEQEAEEDSGDTVAQSEQAPENPGENAGPPEDAENGQPEDAGPNFLTITFDEPKSIDLLALQGTTRDFLLDGETLPAGEYEQIRLMVQAEHDGVMDSWIQIDGAQHELRIPSGSQTGLKLVHNFVIEPGSLIDFTIDFDLRKSVVNAPGEGYMLKPVLRMVETQRAGNISGVIDPAVFAEQACSEEDPLVSYAVYVYAGADAVTDDLGSADEPLTTAGVSLDEGSNYTYEVGFLEPGDYTVAATCQADQDDPEADDDIGLVAPANVVVTTGDTTTHNFQ